MKRPLIALALMLAATGCASLQAPENWSAADTRRQIIYGAALALDAATTSRIHEHPGMEERWPVARAVLGPQPDPTETYVVSALMGFAHYWIARRMKPERRRIFQYFAIGSHAAAVRQNCDSELC